MGTQVGRIEQEFVLKSLVDAEARMNIHGLRKEVSGTLLRAETDRMEIGEVEGPLELFSEAEHVRVYFNFRESYHTFTTHVIEVGERRMTISLPPNVYRDLTRKYERVRVPDGIEARFSLKGTHVELDFPKTERIQPAEAPKEGPGLDISKMKQVVDSFGDRMSKIVSENQLVMLRDRSPSTYEEKLIVKTGKILWIPSTEEDFPLKDPFPDERLLTKSELHKYEESQGTAPRIIVSKLGNYLYEKRKSGVHSELYCPILYQQYAAGYVHLINTVKSAEKIPRQVVDYVHQFARILCYSLEADGYFTTEESGETRYRAPIIDVSASGLLFAHSSAELSQSLPLHADLDISMDIGSRSLNIGSRIMRTFKNSGMFYYGVQFLRIETEDFQFLFEHLYGKPFKSEYEDEWEGGAPPPALDIF